MLPWKGKQVYVQFSEIRIKLAGKPEAASDARNGSRDKVVQIGIYGGTELEPPVANFI